MHTHCSHFNRTKMNDTTKTNCRSFNSVNNFTSVFRDFFDNFSNNVKRRKTQQHDPAQNSSLHLSLGLSFGRTVFNNRGRVGVDRLRAYNAYDNDNTGPKAHPDAYNAYDNAKRMQQTAHAPFNDFARISTYPAYNNANRIVRSHYGIYNNDNRARRAGGLGVAIPTKISGNAQLQISGRNSTKLQNKPTNSLCICLFIDRSPTFGQSNVGVLSSLHIDCLRTVLNYGLGMRAISNPMRIRVPTNARPNAILALRSQNIPGLNGPIDQNSRLVAIRISVPAQLGPRRQRLVRGLTRVHNSGIGQKKVRKFLKKLFHK